MVDVNCMPNVAIMVPNYVVSIINYVIYIACPHIVLIHLGVGVEKGPPVYFDLRR